MSMKMRLKLALQLLVEVKEKTGDGNMPGYLMKKILMQLFVSFVETSIDTNNILLVDIEMTKKCTKCLVHVGQEMEDSMNGKKNQKEQLKMRNEDFEDIDEEVESRRVVSNISRGGSNRGRVSAKRSREKGSMDHFFTPGAEVVVQTTS